MATAYELQAANEAQFGEDPMMAIMRKKVQTLVAPYAAAQQQFAPPQQRGLTPISQERLQQLRQPVIKPLGIEDNSNLVQFGVGDKGAAGMMAESVAIPELRKGMFGRAFNTVKDGVRDIVTMGAYSQMKAKKNQLIGDFQKQVEDMMKSNKQPDQNQNSYFDNSNQSNKYASW